MIDDSYPLKVERLSIEDGGGFVAYALDLPGCMSDGETEDEARENGRAAVREWLDEARRLGRRTPAPRVVGVKNIDSVDGYTKSAAGLDDATPMRVLHHHA